MCQQLWMMHGGDYINMRISFKPSVGFHHKQFNNHEEPRENQKEQLCLSVDIWLTKLI